MYLKLIFNLILWYKETLLRLEHKKVLYLLLEIRLLEFVAVKGSVSAGPKTDDKHMALDIGNFLRNRSKSLSALPLSRVLPLLNT